MSKRESLRSLTSLRFFAAISIVLYHAQVQFPFLATITREFELEQGVSFFFVLSGFILTFAYKDLTPSNSKEYLTARFWRIYPVHLVSLVILLALLPQNCLLLKDWGICLSYLTMTHAWIPIEKYYFAWNSPSWSISTEWFFYICLPALVLVGRKNPALPILITFFSFSLTSLIATYSKIPLYSLDHFSVHGLLYVNPLARLFEFALGITLAMNRDRIRDIPNPTFVEALSILFMAIMCHLSTKSGYLTSINIPKHAILWLSHWGFSALSSVILVLVFQQEKGKLSRLLKFPPLIIAGEASFSMYMIHNILLRYKFETLPLNDTVSDFVHFFVILLACSFFIFVFIETPLRNLGKPPELTRKSLRRNVNAHSIAQFTIKAAIAAGTIYWLIPGAQNYQRTLISYMRLTIQPVDFDKRISLREIYITENTLHCHFKALKNILLFEAAEIQLLDEKLHFKAFHRQYFTAKPVSTSEGSFFDIKFPLENKSLKAASYISVKLVRHNGKPLYPQSGLRDQDGTRLLIHLPRL